MSTYTNKLKVTDKSGNIYYCSVYTTEAEATPTSGRALKVGVLVDGVVNTGYLALTPVSLASSDASPLTVTVDKVAYYINKTSDGGSTEYITFTISPVSGETISFTCNGVTKDVTTSTGAQEFSVPVGAAYSIVVTPDDAEHYNAGAISGAPASGAVSSALKDLKIGAPTGKELTVTIKQPTGGTITVNGNTKTFTGHYGDALTMSFTCDSTHEGGTLKVDGTTTIPSTLVSAITVTVDDITAIPTYTVTLKQGTGVASVTMKVNDKEIASGASVLRDSTVVITATAKDGYEEPTITIS